MQFYILFIKNLIYIDILCNNCIFLVFCFYILYIAPFLSSLENFLGFPEQESALTFLTISFLINIEYKLFCIHFVTKV